MTYTFYNQKNTVNITANSDEQAWLLLRATFRDKWLEYDIVSVDGSLYENCPSEADSWDGDDSQLG